MSVYDSCAAAHGEEDVQLMMKCLATWVESVTDQQPAPNGLSNDVKSWLLVLAGAMVFFMQAGFAMVCAGAIRKKNVNNTMIKNLLDACGSGLAFCVCGYALAFGHGNDAHHSSYFMGGGKGFFLTGDTDPAHFFFQFAFCATSATIVAGTLAERCQMVSYFAYSLWLTGFVYPIVAHNIWSDTGYLSPFNADALVGRGMIDFSGSGVVHVTGGMTALYATCILGPRSGRFTDKNGKPLERPPGLIKGHSMSLQMLGTMILWFCWYGFNAGSALLLTTENTGTIAAHAAVATTLAAGAGTASALFTNGYLQQRRTGEFVLDISMSMNGCLSGLVANTAGCAVVDYWAAIIIGIVSGWVYIAFNAALLTLKIDDAVAAIPVHLGNGLWGVIAVGFFATPDLLWDAYGFDTHVGLFYSRDEGSNLLPAQLMGILFIVGWTFVTMLPFFLALNHLKCFRVNELEEIVGLDASYTGNVLSLSGNEDESLQQDELRLAAYHRRREEKQDIKEKKPIKKMTLAEVMTNSSFGTAPEEAWLPRRKHDKARPEQAPKKRSKSRGKEPIQTNTEASNQIEC